MAKANSLSGGVGFAIGGGDGGEADGAGTTEDPYVQASLKRSIVELYDTCHRLLSFKVRSWKGSVGVMFCHGVLG